MKVLKISDLTTIFNYEKKPLIAIWGFFDGWHLGHQSLVKQMQNLAKTYNYSTLVVSFNVKPQSILLNKTMPILLNNHDKQQFLIDQQIDYYCQLVFNHDIVNKSAQEFISWLLNNNVVAVVSTKDVHFGVQRQGNLTTLQKSPLKVFISQDVVTEKNQKVSSSYIKELLVNKKITQANKLLCTSLTIANGVAGYMISGKVVSGIKEGRTLGFPTANLELTDNYVLPGFAVYISLTEVDDKWYQSMTIILIRNAKPLVETYLLNFNQNIYGKIIRVKFLSYLRDNLVFSNKEDLVAQIKEDLANTVSYFHDYEFKKISVS
ncbi:MAG: riboflavin biosynthesis protein RibF [Spiroplasma sp.]